MLWLIPRTCGTVTAEMTELLGVGYASPRNASRLYSVNLRVRPEHRSEREKALALWEEGMSQAEIARAQGVSRQRVWQLVRGMQH